MKAFENVSQIVTLQKVREKDGRRLSPNDLSIVSEGAVVFDSNKIHWVGETNKIPHKYRDVSRISLKEKILLPEIVDSHTHLIFAGDRSKEYSMRLNGIDYAELARQGGGILSTVKDTDTASLAELERLAKERIEQIYSYGVGSIEIKSGYGLNWKKEEEISRLIYKLKKFFAPRIQIQNTYMAAHATPPDYATSRSYLLKIVIPLMESLAGEKVIDAVDIFHEEGYFDSQDTTLLFDKAKKLNLPVKGHADEFKDNKGAILACKYNALSADHLLQTKDDGIKALANSSTVATLLPGTGFFLGKKQAHARKFLDAGIKVAIASDYNPGSCHCNNLILLASLAAPIYKMNICEMWAAITFNSAHALGLTKQGAIVPGLHPRFSIFNTNSIDKIAYSWGSNLALRDRVWL